MLRHVVMMQLTAESTNEDAAAIVAGLETLPGLVPDIRSYSIGRDAGLAEGNFDIVLVADFDDEAGFRAYSENPDHIAVITERIRPVLANRTAVQHIID